MNKRIPSIEDLEARLAAWKIEKETNACGYADIADNAIAALKERIKEAKRWQKAPRVN